jgi:hypothetical protein
LLDTLTFGYSNNGTYMQFEYTPPQTPLEEAMGGFRAINAFGGIVRGDDERLVDLVRNAAIPPRTSVYINSSGGDVETAISIGRFVRDCWFSTHIGQYILDGVSDSGFFAERKRTAGMCMSAATLVFLGGQLRFIEAADRFGVHQFAFKNPTPAHISRSQILSANIARFIADMGINPEFLTACSASENIDIQELSHDELRRLRVSTGGETAVDWTLQAIGNALYVRGERDNIYGHHKMVLGYAKPNGFFVYAVIESQGREKELTTFPLVELVIGMNEDIVLDITSRCRRTVEGIYTNIVAPITNQEAKALATSDGFGIRVRGGSDAGIFLGVGPMATEGAQDKLTSFVTNLS